MIFPQKKRFIGKNLGNTFLIFYLEMKYIGWQMIVQ
jgi:hypothetical protein